MVNKKNYDKSYLAFSWLKKFQNKLIKNKNYVI